MIHPRRLTAGTWEYSPGKGKSSSKPSTPASPDLRTSLWWFIHPRRLTWNLQITHLERKMIFQTSMIIVHVNLPGCNGQAQPPAPSSTLGNPVTHSLRHWLQWRQLRTLEWQEPGIVGLEEFDETSKWKLQIILQGTNISPKNDILKMIFLFPRWDMLVPCRVSLMSSYIWWKPLKTIQGSTLLQE